MIGVRANEEFPRLVEQIQITARARRTGCCTDRSN